MHSFSSSTSKWRLSRCGSNENIFSDMNLNLGNLLVSLHHVFDVLFSEIRELPLSAGILSWSISIDPDSVDSFQKFGLFLM